MKKQEFNYEVNLVWEDRRKGSLTSPDLVEAIEVATPPDFPGGMEGIWSPEHLFVASVNSCLMTTFLAVADNSGLEYTGFSSKAVGKLERVEGVPVISTITLQPEVVVTKSEDIAKAERILQKSESACLISNSIKTNILFKPNILVEALTY